MKKIIISFLVCTLFLSFSACRNNSKCYEEEFSDSIFWGDSITMGFSFNKILSEDNVIAGAGATAGFLYGDIETIVERKPQKIYILIGQCDILMPVDNPMELFKTDYVHLIETIQSRLPDSKIYLQSITHITKEALQEEPRYNKIDDYNKIIQNISKKLSVTYIDLNSLIKKHTDLYAEEGIHFKKEFYPLWLDYVLEKD